jgi:hypothetical protein
MHFLRMPLFAATLFVLAGCQSVEVRPPADVASAPRLEVSGRQGWLPGRHIAFGEFSTSGLEKHVDGGSQSCPNGCSHLAIGQRRSGDIYSQRFDETFEHATTRLEFVLEGREGTVDSHTRVRTVEEYTADNREWITRWFRIPTDVGAQLQASSWRVGTVEPGAAAPWHFVLWHQTSVGVTGMDRAVGGWAEADGHDARLAFVPLPSPFPGGVAPAGFPVMSPGWSFELEGRTLGAVDLMGPGHVWIRPDATPDQRQLVAALSTVLLLQQPH